MVLQDEIQALQASMPNVKQQLVCGEATKQTTVYQGVIDQTVITQVMQNIPINNRQVFLCGPKPMLDAGKKHLKAINVASKNIHYEQLSF